MKKYLFIIALNFTLEAFAITINDLQDAATPFADFYDDTNNFSNVANIGGYCSATLIAPRVLLTAAHCVSGGTQTSAISLQPDATDDIKNFKANIYSIGDAIHPSYDDFHFTSGHDVGLVYLSKAITDISSATLGESQPANSTVTLVGYGLAGTGSNPGLIYDYRRRVAYNSLDFIDAEINLPSIEETNEDFCGNDEDCLATVEENQQAIVLATDFDNPENEAFSSLGIAVALETEGTTNGGDSGGPLFAEDLTGNLILIGVTSAGYITSAIEQIGGQFGGYGDIATWAPVYLNIDFIQANIPIFNTAAQASANDGNWQDATYWVDGVVPNNLDRSVDYFERPVYYDVTLDQANSNITSTGTVAIANLTLANETTLTIEDSEFSATGITEMEASRLNISGGLYATAYLNLLQSTVDLTTGTLISVNGINVDANSRLQGNGTFAGGFTVDGDSSDVTNAGTLAPGHSVGQLTIANANYVQAAEGIFEQEIDATGSDVLKVTGIESDGVVLGGTATLAGTLQTTFLNGFAPVAGDRYDVILAETIEGTFDTYEYDSEIELELVYLDNTVRVLVDPRTIDEMLANKKLSSRQKNLVNILDQARQEQATDNFVDDFYTEFYSLDNTQEQLAALDSLVPENVFSQINFSQDFAAITSNHLIQRSRERRALSISTLSWSGFNVSTANPSEKFFLDETLFEQEWISYMNNNVLNTTLQNINNPWGVFVAGDVVIGERNLENTTTDSEFHTNGLTLGVDYEIEPIWTLGLAFSYANDNSKEESSKNDSHGRAVSLYTTVLIEDNGYINEYLSYGWNDYDLSREISIGATTDTATATPNGHQYGAGISGGYDFKQGNLTYGPLIALDYASVSIESYTEVTDSGLGMTVKHHTEDTLLAGLGGEASYQWMLGKTQLNPRMAFSLKQELLNDSSDRTIEFIEIPGQSFSLQGTKEDNNWIEMELGITVVFNPTTIGFMSYKTDLERSNIDSDELYLGAKWQF